MTTTLRRQPTPVHRPMLPGDVRWTLALARGLTVLGAVLIAASAVAWLIRQPAFTLRAIEVRGDVQRVGAAAVRSQALPLLRGNFFTLDLAQAAAAFEAVPWVRRAVVQRVWPNRLRVTIEEHQAAAFWTTDDITRLVNRQGEVFEANIGAVDDDDLPTLEGPAGAAARMLQVYRALGPAFAQINLTIDRLSLSGRGSWKATLATGAVVEIGRGDDAQVLARTARFVHALPEMLQRFPRPLEHADLRHRDGFALRLAGLTTDPATQIPAVRAPANRPAPVRPAATNR